MKIETNHHKFVNNMSSSKGTVLVYLYQTSGTSKKMISCNEIVIFGYVIKMDKDKCMRHKFTARIRRWLVTNNFKTRTFICGGYYYNVKVETGNHLYDGVPYISKTFYNDEDVHEHYMSGEAFEKVQEIVLEKINS